MEAELLTLLIIHVLGVSVFGKFESETAWWKLTLKWVIILALTYTVYSFYGHVGAFSLFAFMLAVSLSVHFIWCKRKGVHPIKATPKRKYYELRNWKWTE